MLLDIVPNTFKQADLLMNIIPASNSALMKTCDEINKKYGRDTVSLAASGIKREWQMRVEKRSPRYTTNWNELPIVVV